jgi:hypothetical protein
MNTVIKMKHWPYFRRFKATINVISLFSAIFNIFNFAKIVTANITTNIEIAVDA